MKEHTHTPTNTHVEIDTDKCKDGHTCRDTSHIEKTKVFLTSGIPHIKQTDHHAYADHSHHCTKRFRDLGGSWSARNKLERQSGKPTKTASHLGRGRVSYGDC